MRKVEDGRELGLLGLSLTVTVGLAGDVESLKHTNTHTILRRIDDIGNYSTTSTCMSRKEARCAADRHSLVKVPVRFCQLGRTTRPEHLQENNEKPSCTCKYDF